MTLLRPILFTALCLDAGSAPNLTKGREYRVVDQFDVDGIAYLNVLCDKGTLFTYSAQRFQWKEKQ